MLMVRRGFLGVAAGGMTVLLGGCDPFVRTSGYRVRVTVEAATPDGVRRGFSVIAVNAAKGSFRLGDKAGNSIGASGDAILVDRPDGLLAVLLDLPNSRGSLGGPATSALVAGTPRARGLNKF